MLGLNEEIDQLAEENGVRQCGHFFRKDDSCFEEGHHNLKLTTKIEREVEKDTEASG